MRKNSRLASFQRKRLTTRAWQPIADHNEWPKPYTTIRRFLFELVDMISPNRNYWELRNLLYLNILETGEILQFLNKEILEVARHSSARDSLYKRYFFSSSRYNYKWLHFNHLRWQLIADHNEWPKPYIIRRFLPVLVGMIEIIKK